MNLYNVIGVMSGTSLDGVDIALCEFKKDDNNKWSYEIKLAKTYEYDAELIERLKNADKLNAFDFIKLHKEYGHYLGNLINEFLLKYKTQNTKHKTKFNIDFISSHGHTIFHQPDKGITFQIGEGAAIAATTGMKVVCDFRTTDVALGGQGAPLVPIGDRLLFHEYDYCLNLGGFANISFELEVGSKKSEVGGQKSEVRSQKSYVIPPTSYLLPPTSYLLPPTSYLIPHTSYLQPPTSTRIAYDICPVNIIFNKLAGETGKQYDNKGEIAGSGKINSNLLNELNELEYYKRLYPKSLSKEWLDKYFIPIIEKYDIPVKDKLRTTTEHIAFQIVRSLEFGVRSLVSVQNIKRESSILVSGGGAYNDFLVKRIISLSKNQIVIPDKKIIDFKEALIFAFLGVLRIRNETNCLSSVTGAIRDNIGGAIYNE